MVIFNVDGLNSQSILYYYLSVFLKIIGQGNHI